MHNNKLKMIQRMALVITAIKYRSGQLIFDYLIIGLLITGVLNDKLHFSSALGAM